MNKENLIYNLWYRQPDWYSWSKAFLLSVFLHLGILLAVFTFSSNSQSGVALPMVYNVELVGQLQNPKPIEVTPGKKNTGHTRTTRNTGARVSSSFLHRSIPIWRVKASPVSAVNPAIEKAKPELPRVESEDSSKMVGEELAKLAEEAAVASRKNVKKNIHRSSTVGKTVSSGAKAGKDKKGILEAGTTAKGEALSLARSTYYAEVWDRIRKEWALSSELLSKKGNLTATIVIKIRRDGKILNARFEERSGDEFFDDSVWRAVWKANPLPPFPQIYSVEVDELGIRFRLEELLK